MAANPTANESGGGKSRLRGVLGDWRWQMGFIICLALIPRMVYLSQIYRWPFFYYPVLDSQTQYHWANILIQSFGMGNLEVVGKAPLYSYFLAFNRVAIGQEQAGLFMARLLQLSLGAVTCGLTYMIGRRLFGAAAGLVAGLLAAAYAPGIFDDGELLDTALATFLATAFLLAVLSTLESPTRRRWIGCGVLLGLLGLARPNLLVLAVWVAGLLVFSCKRRAPGREFRFLLVFLLAVAATILPITLRNYRVVRAFVPIATNGGINLYTGNNPEADGYSPIAAGIAWERAHYRTLNADVVRYGDVDRYWRRQGLQFWRDHPGQALSLLVKKAYLYWNAYEIPNNLSYDWGREHSSLLKLVPLTFAVVGPLALLGVAFGLRREESVRLVTAFVVLQMLGVIVFFVCARYRMPAVPAMMVLAGYGITQTVAVLRRRRWAAASGALVGLAVFAVFVNSDWYGAKRTKGANRDWFYVGQSYYSSGDYAQARDAWQRATQENPQDADAYSFLGNVEVELGDDKAAVKYMEHALKIAPDMARAATQLATIHLRNGWPLDVPEKLLREAVTYQHLSVMGLSTLVKVEVQQGHLTEAGAHLERAARALSMIHPSDSRRHGNEAAFTQALTAARAAGVELPEAYLGSGGSPAGAHP